MSLQPLQGHILIRRVPTNDTVRPSGIIVPSGNKVVTRGEVVALGAQVLTVPSQPLVDFAVGSSVLYYAESEIYTDSETNLAIVPANAIVGVLQDDSPKSLGASAPLFVLPPWNEFVGANFEKWREYSNATLFSFRINFLETFSDLSDVAHLMYEYSVDELRTEQDLDLDHVQFRVIKDKDDDGQGSMMYAVVSTDDKWHGTLAVGARNRLQFSKHAMTLQNLHETVPAWMRVYSRLLHSPAFRRVVGKDFSRVKNVVIGLHQEIRLKGRGRHLEPVRNSDLMEQFLLLKGSDDRKQQPTLEALGIPNGAVRRVDMKVGFEKRIEDHNYIVFFDVEAPANDDLTHLSIDWEIQDHNPGNLLTREYGPVFTTFFRNIIFKAFYSRWFHENADVTCVTELR